MPRGKKELVEQIRPNLRESEGSRKRKQSTEAVVG